MVKQTTTRTATAKDATCDMPVLESLRYVSTQLEVAKAIGVGKHTVKEWLAEGAPVKTSQGYDVEAIRNWRALTKTNSYVEEEGETEEIEDPNAEASIGELKRRKLLAEVLEVEAKAILKAYEAEQTTKDVVHLDDVNLWVSQMLTELRRLHLRVPKEMAAGYPKEFRAELEKDLADRFTLVLRSLHGYAIRTSEIRG